MMVYSSPKKSYFVSNICLDMMRNSNVQGRDKFVLDNLNATGDARYIHFPICHDSHWTLIVHDIEDGNWKHYNSMRERPSIMDVHYQQGNFLKNIVTEVVRRSLHANNLGDLVETQDSEIAMESVVRCPQQWAKTLCAIMRQYVHHLDVGQSLHRGNYSVLRATMVKGFINDPGKGLAASVMQNSV